MIETPPGFDGPDRRRASGARAKRPPVVTVVGQTELRLPTAGWRGFDFRTDSVGTTIECSTGSETEGRWSGLPLLDLFEAAGMPAATHVLVTGADGFRCCPEIAGVLDGILAFERTDGSGVSEEVPRLVAPALDGTRTVRRVERIEGVSLDPGRDRSSLESF